MILLQVSGDNPVYVESAKAGGAAQKSGLLQGDMILMVNGTNVRSSSHTHVVQLIKCMWWWRRWFQCIFRFEY